jgi:hypothetical protein
MVLRSQDEAIPRVTDTLAAAQGAGSSEVAKDEDQDMVYEDGHFISLIEASSILMRIWWSGDSDGSSGTIA